MPIRKHEKKITQREKEVREKSRQDDWELYRTEGGEKTFQDLENDTQAGNLSLYGDDLDSDWKIDEATGEENVAGSVITPDKDQIEEIGEGVGLTYKDDEELNDEKKIKWKEAQQWEPNTDNNQGDD